MLLLLLLVFPIFPIHSQTDTVFWFAMPGLSNQYGRIPVQLVFHTYDQPATVTMEQPMNSYPFIVPSVLHMAANSMHETGFHSIVDYYETVPVNTVLNRGVYIHSTAPITCYYQSISTNRETYTLKGRNALGTDFQVLVPVENQPNVQHDNGMRVEMVATEDSTCITVTTPNYNSPPDTLLQGGIGCDSAFVIRLNRGQSYALQANHYGIDIIKMKIHSTNPIAVSVTSDAQMSRNQSNIPHTYNLVGEQLLPLSFWGVRYIWINNNEVSEWFRSTDFVDDSGTYNITVNTADYVRTNMMRSGLVWNMGWSTFSDPVMFVESERPVGMVHQTDPNLQMGFTMLPQIECSGSHQIAYHRSDTMPLIIHMIIESHAVNDIFFNDDSTILTSAVFHPVPGLPSYSWCNIDVSQHLSLGSVMNIRCATSKFLLAVIESDSNRGSSYTYLTDYAPYAQLRFNMDTSFCTGQRITFTYEAENIDSIALRCPDGRVLTTPPFVISPADSTCSGRYWITGVNVAGCGHIYTDSIDIYVAAKTIRDMCDTIVESQLPWRYRGQTYTHETDTTFQDTLASQCDSIHYRLHIRYNDYDTLLYYVCPNAIPFSLDTGVHGGTPLQVWGDTVATIVYTREGNGDSSVTYILHVIPTSDTVIVDSVLESQLPWFFFDTLFSDTVHRHPFHLYNEQGCDSTIYYSLYVFWDSDRCDTTLTFPNTVTPNGDGHNERFVIGGLLENSCFKYNELFIYDRTGRLVYSLRNITSADDWWDPNGTNAHHGHWAPDGTYFYIFKAHGATIYTTHQGVIEVLR